MRSILGAILAATMIASPAVAHTTLKRTSPASGAVLSQSPEQVSLTFGEPTRLTSVSVVTTAGERRLSFTPSGSAMIFVVARPVLSVGRNELRWRALSRDGHPVQGAIILVVRPPNR